jgi:hypothetical protein
MTVLVLVCALCLLKTASMTSGKACGVDGCAFAGLALAIGVAFTAEFSLLVVLGPAFGADWRAGLGVVLYGVGVNLLLAVAPSWSQYQGVMGVAFGYTGLWLAAWPWLAPLRRPRSSLDSLG